MEYTLSVVAEEGDSCKATIYVAVFNANVLDYARMQEIFSTTSEEYDWAMVLANKQPYQVVPCSITTASSPTNFNVQVTKPTESLKLVAVLQVLSKFLADNLVPDKL